MFTFTSCFQNLYLFHFISIECFNKVFPFPFSVNQIRTCFLASGIRGDPQIKTTHDCIELRIMLHQLCYHPCVYFSVTSTPRPSLSIPSILLDSWKPLVTDHPGEQPTRRIEKSLGEHFTWHGAKDHGWRVDPCRVLTSKFDAKDPGWLQLLQCSKSLLPFLLNQKDIVFPCISKKSRLVMPWVHSLSPNLPCALVWSSGFGWGLFAPGVISARCAVLCGDSQFRWRNESEEESSCHEFRRVWGTDRNSTKFYTLTSWRVQEFMFSPNLFHASYFSLEYMFGWKKSLKEAAWNCHRIGPGASPTLMCEPPNGDLYSFKSSLCTSFARCEGRILDQNFAFYNNRRIVFCCVFVLVLWNPRLGSRRISWTGYR